MTNDIVARIRLYANASIDGGWANVFRSDLNIAADEIERLRKECFHLAANQCHAGYGGEYGHHRCAEIDRLTAERDEARWRLCKVLGDNRGVWGCEIAKENGWDYMATEAKP